MNAESFHLFYKMKPFIPRSIQLFLRQQRAKRIFSRLESPYVLDQKNNSTYFHPPDGYDCILLLTHDIETKKGLLLINPLRKIELSEGVVSTWNFVLKKYDFSEDIIPRLHDEGCECGAHGLIHDGKLFKDESTYFERMDDIAEIANRLKLKGFRSPALHRNIEWMKTLPFRWDSSFPAWDPFQPQTGGCEQYSPFKLNKRTWELPVTLFQDFTLFYELKEKSIGIWIAQATALAGRKMLINVIVHPDYTTEHILGQYRNFIQYCKEKLNPWITTPSALCDWLDKEHE